jgi:hypothetical protein
VREQEARLLRISAEEQDRIMQRMQEIALQARNLQGPDSALPLIDRIERSTLLTREWLANLNKLREGSAICQVPPGDVRCNAL